MEQVINQKKKIFCKQNIPNMLIIFRIVLTVVIITLLLIPATTTQIFLSPTGNFSLVYELQSPFAGDVERGVMPYTEVYANQLAAGILFLLACLSDWLDGLIARKFNWVSNFGKLWDPIADKILINSVLICFAYWQMIPAFIPIIMIARDVAVDADRMVAAKKNVVVAANIYGKLKTIMQMVACIVIFFILNAQYTVVGDPLVYELYDERALWWGVQNLGMYMAAVLSILSGVIYFIDIHKKTKLANDAKQN